MKVAMGNIGLEVREGGLLWRLRGMSVGDRGY